MNETKFTPGPWLFSSYKSGNSVIVIDGKEFDVATVNYPNRDANAHLIAAAPDLYEALKNTTAHLVAAHSLLQSGGQKAAASNTMFEIMLKDYEKSIEVGRAALSKARGEG